MRFITTADEEKAIDEISKEIMNFETGTLYWIDGEPNPALRTESGPEAYPSFKLDGVMVSIRVNAIGLVLPAGRHTYMVDRIRSRVDMYESEYSGCTGVSVLETGADSFTLLQADNKLTETHSLDHGGNSIQLKRKIVSHGQISKYNKYIGSRITWFVLTPNNIIQNIETCGQEPPLQLQISTIFYDPTGMTRFGHRHLLIDNLLLEDFRAFHRLLNITAYGNINHTDIDKLPPGNYKKYRDQCQNLIRLPEFRFGWCNTPFTIMLCPERKAAIEIIRHLGNSQLINAWGPSIRAIRSLPCDVYQVDFHNIVITNPEPDKCAYCGTPLYDDVYGIFQPGRIMCTAYCPVCIHSDRPLVEQHTQLARFVYPRTVDQVIDSMLKLDPDVRAIIKGAMRGVLVDTIGMHSAVHINFDKPDQAYIGWTNDAIDYIEYTNNQYTRISGLLGREKCAEYLQNARLFRCQLLKI